MKTYVKLGMLLIIVVGMMIGCNYKETASVDKVSLNGEQDLEQTPIEATQIESLVLIDDLGREVVIEQPLEKVVALSRSYMEELFELGVTPLAKVEEYNYREEGVQLPSISNQSNPDIEKIYALSPDLIIANTRQHAEMLDLLEQSGAVVYFLDPNKVIQDPLTDRIVLFGQLLGKESEAEAYVVHLDQVTKTLIEALENYPYETGLLVQGTGEGIQVAQPTGFYGALLMRLGIENIVETDLQGSAKSTWVTYDLEQILAKDPDIILIRATGNDDYQELLDKYMTNPAWQTLTAIKEEKVFILPAEINPGNISNEEALRTTANIIIGNN